jgi:hypothetical protein
VSTVSDAASQRLRNMRGAFNGTHRLKYAQYILESVEVGFKSNFRWIFKFANMKRYSSGYPSAMFLDDTCETRRK